MPRNNVITFAQRTALRSEAATLPARIAERLRALIHASALPPGSKLNERNLCEQLRVSRTPLREAFKILAGEGLIELAPNRSAVVSALSRDDVRATFDVLSRLEGLVGELAAQRIGKAALEEIEACHFEMLAAYTRKDLPRYFELNQSIHQALYDASGNAVLIEECARLNSRIRRVRYSAAMTPAAWARAVDEHTDMIKHLKSRASTKLRALLEAHLAHKCEVVLAALAAQDASERSA